MKLVPRTMGGKIKQARELKEWRQADLSLRTGVDQAVISRYEANKIKRPQLEDLQKIADALELSVEYLTAKEYELKHLPDELADMVRDPEAIPFLMKVYTEYAPWKVQKEMDEVLTKQDKENKKEEQAD